MTKLKINDLPESQELDHQAMSEILGGSRSLTTSRPEMNRQKKGKSGLLKRLRKAH